MNLEDLQKSQRASKLFTSRDDSDSQSTRFGTQGDTQELDIEEESKHRRPKAPAPRKAAAIAANKKQAKPRKKITERRIFEHGAAHQDAEDEGDEVVVSREYRIAKRLVIVLQQDEEVKHPPPKRAGSPWLYFNTEFCKKFVEDGGERLQAF